MKAIGIFATLLCFVVSSYAQDTIAIDTCLHIGEVMVTNITGMARMKEIATPISVISQEMMQTHQSTNIIDIISRQPGVSQITTGSGISKPVIRGLGYNRVLVVSDGIRQEGQQWGDEHGIEIDAHRINNVEVIKGPASLMYGSDAMAGVIIMNSIPTLPEGEFQGKASAEYQTNNGLIDYSALLNGNKNGYVWQLLGSNKMAHDYQAPQDGYVNNSRFAEHAVSGIIGANKSWGHSHLKLSYYHLTPGMTEVEDEYQEGNSSYSKEAPFQEVNHYKAVSDNIFQFGDNYLKAIVGYQQNRRQEYEEAEECELDFMLHTISYDVRYAINKDNNWKINTGIGGMYQQSINKGEEYLIPDYHHNDIGTYITTSKRIAENANLSGGLRYDIRNLHSLSLFDDEEERFSDFHRQFKALSGSMGIIINMSEAMDFKANISHGYRAPNMSELGSNGEHEGTFRYEVGNPNLDAEKSWQIDLGLDYTSNIFSASLSVFANRINDYIFLNRTNNVTAEDIPIYNFAQGNAQVTGGEARIIIHPVRHLHFENTFSYVDARQLNQPTESRYLPLTPAPRWLSTLHYDIPCRKSRFANVFAEIEANINMQQNHIYKANDTEREAPSYTLFNIATGLDFKNKKEEPLCSIYLNCTNIFDKAYQSHLSRLKYADTESLTGRKGINNIGRNISIKLIVKINKSKDF